MTLELSQRVQRLVGLEVTGLAEELAVRRVVVTASTQWLLVMELRTAELAGPVVRTGIARAFAGATGSSAYRGLDRIWKRQGVASFLAGFVATLAVN